MVGALGVDLDSSLSSVLGPGLGQLSLLLGHLLRHEPHPDRLVSLTKVDRSSSFQHGLDLGSLPIQSISCWNFRCLVAVTLWIKVKSNITKIDTKVKRVNTFTTLIEIVLGSRHPEMNSEVVLGSLGSEYFVNYLDGAVGVVVTFKSINFIMLNFVACVVPWLPLRLIIILSYILII